MESLKLIGTSLCITVLITSIFSMLIPKLKLKSAINTAVSLFFLISLVSPFLSADFSFSVPAVFDYQEKAPIAVSEKISEQFLSLAEANLEQSIKSSLKKSGIIPKEIEIKINIAENDCISINKLNVILDKGESKKLEEVISKITEETGVCPKISFQ